MLWHKKVFMQHDCKTQSFKPRLSLVQTTADKTVSELSEKTSEGLLSFTQDESFQQQQLSLILKY